MRVIHPKYSRSAAALLTFLFFSSLCTYAGQYAEGLKLVGRVPYPHCWHAQFVKKGNYLFVTGNETVNKLKIVDVSDPANMKVVATSEVSGHNAANTIRVHENLLLVNCYRSIVPIDISDPLKPKVLTGCEWAPDGLAFDAERVWGYSYVWHRDALFLMGKKLRVYAVEETFKPRLIATFDMSQYGGKASGPLVGDGFYFVCGKKVVCVDVGEPSSPKVSNIYSFDEPVSGLVVSGKTFFTIRRGQEEGKAKKKEGKRVVVAFDVSNPQAPRELGRYEGLRVPARLVVHNKTLYVIGADDVPREEQTIDDVSLGRTSHWFRYRTVLEAVDIADPANMSRKASFQFPLRWMRYPSRVSSGLVADGDTLYASENSYGIYAFDVRDPSKLKMAGRVCTVSTETPGALIKGNYLYAAGGRGMLPVDISDPQNPRVAGGVIHTPPLRDRNWACLPDDEARIDGSPYVYFPGGGDLFVYDVSDPKCPKLSARFQHPRTEFFRITRSGDFLYGLATTQRKEFGAFSFRLSEENGLPSFVNRCALPLPVYPPTSYWGAKGGQGAPIFTLREDRLYVVMRIDRCTGVEGKARMAIFVVDVSNPEALTLLGSTITEPLIPAVQRDSASCVYKGHLYLTGGKTSQKFVPQKHCIHVYDARDPKSIKLVNTVYDPHPCIWFYSGLAVLYPYPYLAVKEYMSGLRLFDITDPAKPELIWKEPRPVGHDYETYGRCAWHAGVFSDGHFYRSGLDHLDVFKLVLKPGSRPDRKAALANQVASIKKALAQGKLPPETEAAAKVGLKCVAYYEGENDLQNASLVATELLEILAKGLKHGEVACVAYKATQPITIEANPKEWQHLPSVPFANGPVTAKFQWDHKNIYLLLEIEDADLEPVSLFPEWRDKSRAQDMVHVFFSAFPPQQTRRYGPADLCLLFSLDVRLQVEWKRNPRFPGLCHGYGHTTKHSKGYWRRTDGGYLVEMQLAHEETWVEAREGAIVTLLPVVTDKGVGRWFLKPSRWTNYDFVADWPCVKLVGEFKE